MERAFIIRLYDDTLRLLVEAREHVARRPARRRRDLPPHVRLAVSCAYLGVTSRLARIMAWVLVRRAAADGEIGPAGVEAEKRELAAHAPGDDGPHVMLAEAAAPPLKSLSGRCRGLYARVLRMEGIDRRALPAA